MSPLTTIALLIPRAIVRITFGKPAPEDFYEPTVCAWYATVLEEISTFGTKQ